MQDKDAAYCYRCSVVCQSVCLLDTTVSPAKTAEPIEMLFGLWTRVSPESVYWVGARIPPQRKGQFGGLSPQMKCIKDKGKR